MNPDLQQFLDSLAERKGVQHADTILACIEDSRDLAVHGEEGVGFENLCQNLLEWDFPLTKEDYAKIERLGLYYRFPEDTWSFLKKLLIAASSTKP